MNKYTVLVKHAGENSCRYQVVMADLFYVDQGFMFFSKKEGEDKVVDVAAYPVHVVQSVTKSDGEA